MIFEFAFEMALKLVSKIAIVEMPAKSLVGTLIYSKIARTIKTLKVSIEYLHYPLILPPPLSPIPLLIPTIMTS